MMPLLLSVCSLACQPESLERAGRSAYAAGDRAPAPADSLREKEERRLVSPEGIDHGKARPKAKPCG